MMQLLKRIRECISDGWFWNDPTSISLNNFDSSGSAHANPSDQTTICLSSTNAIERLPLDVFIRILKLLEPKDAARLATVCKWLKDIVSDDTLWEYFLQNQKDRWPSTFFAETDLRSGFPLRRCLRQELSFKHIYGERAKVQPGAIIIDGGFGYCKIGRSNYDSPSDSLTTPVEFFSNSGAPIEDRVYDYFETIFKRMHVSPTAQPVIISNPIVLYGGVVSGRQHIVDLRPILFKMGVPAYCVVNQATLAMFSERRTSGILVNTGYSKTKVFPILNGVIMYKLGVETVGVGGLHLTQYLKEQLRQRNVHVSSLSTVRLLKEKLCYVALDYEAELLKDTTSSYRVGSRWYALNQERFGTGELLFQPQIGGIINERGLHQAVAQCIDNCRAFKMKSGHDWFETVVLAGGSARLPGLAKRLEKELHNLVGPSKSNGIRVLASTHGADAAWHGAKLVSNLSTFTDTWCVKRPPQSKLERTPDSTTIFICLFMVSCIIVSVKRKSCFENLFHYVYKHVPPPCSSVGKAWSDLD